MRTEVRRKLRSKLQKPKNTTETRQKPEKTSRYHKRAPQPLPKSPQILVCDYALFEPIIAIVRTPFRLSDRILSLCNRNPDTKTKFGRTHRKNLTYHPATGRH